MSGRTLRRYTLKKLRSPGDILTLPTKRDLAESSG